MTDETKDQQPPAVGLRCRKCGSIHSKGDPVLRSKRVAYLDDRIRRVRYCRNCGTPLVTVEKLVGY